MSIICDFDGHSDDEFRWAEFSTKKLAVLDLTTTDINNAQGMGIGWLLWLTTLDLRLPIGRWKNRRMTEVMGRQLVERGIKCKVP
jgi:hypothetical protein